MQKPAKLLLIVNGVISIIISGLLGSFWLLVLSIHHFDYDFLDLRNALMVFSVILSFVSSIISFKAANRKRQSFYIANIVISSLSFLSLFCFGVLIQINYTGDTSMVQFASIFFSFGVTGGILGLCSLKYGSEMTPF